MPQGQGQRRYTIRIDRQAIIHDMALRGWTQRELARRAKVTEMQVSRLLTGQAATQRVAAKLAKTLGQPVGRYVSVDVPEEPPAPLALSA